jgi:hypothetical protein
MIKTILDPFRRKLHLEAERIQPMGMGEIGVAKGTIFHEDAIKNINTGDPLL